MGSFAWLRADRKTKRKNIVYGDTIKLLIPKEFGGGFIRAVYEDYGRLSWGDAPNQKLDLFGVLAYWNKCSDMDFEGDEYPSTMKGIIERGNTFKQENRLKGVHIGCFNTQISCLKYPLKLVSLSCNYTYEHCVMRSYVDPYQGFLKGYWETYYWQHFSEDVYAKYLANDSELKGCIGKIDIPHINGYADVFLDCDTSDSTSYSRGLMISFKFRNPKYSGNEYSFSIPKSKMPYKAFRAYVEEMIANYVCQVHFLKTFNLKEG